MKIRNILFAGLLSANAMAFANNGIYATVTPLEGNAVVGQETSFKINYKWLTDSERSGKVIYDVAGTNCKGEINIDKHSGALPVAGETTVKCAFDKSAVFQSDTFLQLYDGDVKKETSEHQSGNIIVTNG